MSFLLGIAGQWKYAVYGVLAAGLVLGGWTAAGWRRDAIQLSAAKAELRHEIERRVSSDASRLAMARQLAEAEAQVVVETRVVKERIIQRVPDIRGCDIVDLGVLLNPIRAGMQSTAERPPDPAATP